jgi:ribulose-phosphate 3-epimerase
MKKISIYPSILAIKDDTASWNKRITDLDIPIMGIHYDIWDGAFVPSMMLRPEDITLLQTDLPIDVHLMVRRPSDYFPTILAVEWVKAVAFHVECDEDIHETITSLRNSGKKVWLAILDITPADHLDQYLLEIDYVIVMTIKGGFAGSPFMPEMIPKIAEIHHKNPELPILVDGGVARTTLSLCVDAGADRAVMSSALFNDTEHSWLHDYL